MKSYMKTISFSFKKSKFYYKLNLYFQSFFLIFMVTKSYPILFQFCTTE